MGRLIDADKLEYTCNADECGMLTGCNHCQYNIITEDEIDSAPTVEAIPKADYENRLKADMVAMLKELQYDLYHALCHEIHGKEDCPCTNQTTSCLATFRVCDANEAIYKVIQNKINSLKEKSNEL